MLRNESDLPEPAGVAPVRSSSPWRWVIALAIVIVVVAAAFYQPIPSIYAFLPGPVRDVDGVLEIRGAKTYPSDGRLYVTTVNLDIDVTVAQLIATMFDSTSRIVSKEDVVGDGTPEDVRRQAGRDMRESQRHAKEVALAEVGIARPEGDGVRITGTLPGSPADSVLRAGDMIVAVDGRPVSTTCEVGRAVGARPVGQELTITVRRRGEQLMFELETARGDPTNPDVPIIGIGMEQVGYRFNPGIDVEFDIGQVGGPSAGLMLALGLYDKLTPGDLTQGREIAGTGEIECDGGVLPIGGIEQKVAAAEREGADVFLAPAANSAAAQKVSRDILVIAVSDFDDAVEYLEGVN